MDPKEAKNIMKKGEVRSIGKSKELVSRPQYLIELKTTNYGSNFSVNEEEINKLLYNLYGKSPKNNPKYYQNKSIEISVWTIERDIVTKRIFTTESFEQVEKKKYEDI